MTASVELLFAPATDANPFHVAKMKLIAALARLPVPHVDVTPSVAQIESIGDFIIAVARLNDRLMRAIGDELQANATVPVRLKNFQTPFVDAVEGYALWDVACVGHDLALENLEDA